MGWFWVRKEHIKEVKEVVPEPVVKWTETLDFRVWELNKEIDILMERVRYETEKA